MSRRLTAIIGITRGMGYWSRGHASGVELKIKGLWSWDWFIDHMRYQTSRHLRPIIGSTRGMGGLMLLQVPDNAIKLDDKHETR